MATQTNFKSILFVLITLILIIGSVGIGYCEEPTTPTTETPEQEAQEALEETGLSDGAGGVGEVNVEKIVEMGTISDPGSPTSQDTANTNALNERIGELIQKDFNAGVVTEESDLAKVCDAFIDSETGTGFIDTEGAIGFLNANPNLKEAVLSRMGITTPLGDKNDGDVAFSATTEINDDGTVTVTPKKEDGTADTETFTINPKDIPEGYSTEIGDDGTVVLKKGDGVQIGTYAPNKDDKISFNTNDETGSQMVVNDKLKVNLDTFDKDNQVSIDKDWNVVINPGETEIEIGTVDNEVGGTVSRNTKEGANEVVLTNGKFTLPDGTIVENTDDDIIIEGYSTTNNPNEVRVDLKGQNPTKISNAQVGFDPDKIKDNDNVQDYDFTNVVFANNNKKYTNLVSGTFRQSQTSEASEYVFEIGSVEGTEGDKTGQVYLGNAPDSFKFIAGPGVRTYVGTGTTSNYYLSEDNNKKTAFEKKVETNTQITVQPISRSVVNEYNKDNKKLYDITGRVMNVYETSFYNVLYKDVLPPAESQTWVPKTDAVFSHDKSILGVYDEDGNTVTQDYIFDKQTRVLIDNTLYSTDSSSGKISEKSTNSVCEGATNCVAHSADTIAVLKYGQDTQGQIRQYPQGEEGTVKNIDIQGITGGETSLVYSEAQSRSSEENTVSLTFNSDVANAQGYISDMKADFDFASQNGKTYSKQKVTIDDLIAQETDETTKARLGLYQQYVTQLTNTDKPSAEGFQDWLDENILRDIQIPDSESKDDVTAAVKKEYDKLSKQEKSSQFVVKKADTIEQISKLDELKTIFENELKETFGEDDIDDAEKERAQYRALQEFFENNPKPINEGVDPYESIRTDFEQIDEQHIDNSNLDFSTTYKNLEDKLKEDAKKEEEELKQEMYDYYQKQDKITQLFYEAKNIADNENFGNSGLTFEQFVNSQLSDGQTPEQWLAEKAKENGIPVYSDGNNEDLFGTVVGTGFGDEQILDGGEEVENDFLTGIETDFDFNFGLESSFTNAINSFPLGQNPQTPPADQIAEIDPNKNPIPETEILIDGVVSISGGELAERQRVINKLKTNNNDLKNVDLEYLSTDELNNLVKDVNAGKIITKESVEQKVTNAKQKELNKIAESYGYTKDSTGNIELPNKLFPNDNTYEDNLNKLIEINQLVTQANDLGIKNNNKDYDINDITTNTDLTTLKEKVNSYNPSTQPESDIDFTKPVGEMTLSWDNYYKDTRGILYEKKGDGTYVLAKEISLANEVSEFTGYIPAASKLRYWVKYNDKYYGVHGNPYCKNGCTKEDLENDENLKEAIKTRKEELGKINEEHEFNRKIDSLEENYDKKVANDFLKNNAEKYSIKDGKIYDNEKNKELSSKDLLLYNAVDELMGENNKFEVPENNRYVVFDLKDNEGKLVVRDVQVKRSGSELYFVVNGNHQTFKLRDSQYSFIDHINGRKMLNCLQNPSKNSCD